MLRSRAAHIDGIEVCGEPWAFSITYLPKSWESGGASIATVGVVDEVLLLYAPPLKRWSELLLLLKSCPSPFSLCRVVVSGGVE